MSILVGSTPRDVHVFRRLCYQVLNLNVMCGTSYYYRLIWKGHTCLGVAVCGGVSSTLISDNKGIKDYRRVEVVAGRGGL